MLSRCIGKIISIVNYIIRFYISKLQRLIPHPKLRAYFFKIFGSNIGKNVRIEDLHISNQSSWGFNNMTIGDNSFLSHRSRIDLTGKIYIGNNSIVGGTIFTHQDTGSNLFDSPTTRRYSRKVESVHIGDNVYIAYGSIILCGVNIGNNAVVAAGSVVTNDVPADTLVAGVPATIKKKFN